MRLIKARVVGFQSFDDSGEIEFAEGINLIVGQNNSGKSAFLRALKPQLVDDRHRTPEAWEDFRLPKPFTRLTVSLSGQEMHGILLQPGQRYIPVPVGQNADEFIDWMLDRDSLEIQVDNDPDNGFFAKYPGHRIFVHRDGDQYFSAAVRSQNGSLTKVDHYENIDSSATAVGELWSQKMFYFSAERMAIGQSSHGHAPRLMDNANNLPAVLDTLKGDRGAVFDRLVAHLREIFPTVGNLSVRPQQHGNIEVRVWPTEAQERVELSFPLNSSGTGVAQVTALLAAIMTVENAVIIVDEINSFLHPAAVKALLRILQTEYGQHQYIISTHAPEVIGFSNPRTIHLVKRSGYESSIERLDLNQVENFREVAEHLGISMADVFAADRVVWVEGPTEELCFPLLYQWATDQMLPRGTIFTSVVATGDFISKKRDRKLVYEVYRQLSSATTPLVVSVAFSFDSEAMSEQERADMARAGGGVVHFLPRRHIECYLLDPGAIAAFMVARDQEGIAWEATAVTGRLAELAAERPFLINEWNGDLADENWQASVDAAKLIAQVCGDLSQGRVTFNKKDDTLTLLQLVRGLAPDRIRPLADYVKGLVDAVGGGD